MYLGTVFQTVLFLFLLVPRLRPGLLSLRSVLSSRQPTKTNEAEPYATKVKRKYIQCAQIAATRPPQKCAQIAFGVRSR